jgi:hypothetical protein
MKHEGEGPEGSRTRSWLLAFGAGALVLSMVSSNVTLSAAECARLFRVNRKPVYRGSQSSLEPEILASSC